MARPKCVNPNVTKLPRLPHNARILKRPLFHPAIPSAHTGSSQEKVIYISTTTPFMSAASRVRKLLEIIEKRYRQTNSTVSSSPAQKLSATTMVGTSTKKKRKEGVVLKATSRAIEKALGLALFFQNKQGYEVRIRTGTVSVVDDVVGKEAAECSMKGLPETRVRRLGSVEVEIKLT